MSKRKLVDMTYADFNKIFPLIGCGESFAQEQINKFESLHGFHTCIANFGSFESHRWAVELNYDVEFTQSREQ